MIIISNLTSKNKFLTKYLILLLVVIAIITVGLPYAQSKYVIDDNTSHTQNSESFYFESDLLDLNNSSITYPNWDISAEYYSVYFNLTNFADELRINSLLTLYEITASVENSEFRIETYINGVLGTTGEMLANIKTTDMVEVRVIPIDSSNITSSNITLNIAVTSTAPYTKTLGKIVNITEHSNTGTQNSTYTVNFINNDDKEYARLSILTPSDFSGTLKIAYNSSKVTPDLTSALLRDYTRMEVENTDYYYYEVNLEKCSNYQIDFFKYNNVLTLITDDEDFDILID